MELRHLRYFVAVAEEENVSRAALKLHVSQPALSRQVRDLEDELGFSLFERSAKSVRLTEAGRVFLTESRAVIQSADHAVQTARAVASGSGELHVGYAPSLTARFLPATLRAFQAAAPKIRVKLHDFSTEEMLAGLRAGSLQIAFLLRLSPALLRGLKFEELLRDPICVAVSPSHPFASKRLVTLAEAAAEPIVNYNRKDYPDAYDHLLSVFASLKRKLRIVEEHDSVSSLIAAVESGVGIAIVPESLSCIAGPRLKLAPIHPAPDPLRIGVGWSPKTFPPAAQTFLESSKQVATTLSQ